MSGCHNPEDQPLAIDLIKVLHLQDSIHKLEQRIETLEEIILNDAREHSC
jgi:hypothetical protein